MKTLSTLAAILWLVILSSNLNAQDKSKSDEKIHINIVKTENGKTIKIDTVFTSKEAMNQFLEDNDLQSRVPPTPPVPPAPPVPGTPPAPPAPGLNSDDFHFEFSFDSLDKEMFRFDFNSAELEKILKETEEAIQKALKSQKFNEKDLKRELEELRKEIKKLNSKERSELPRIMESEEANVDGLPKKIRIISTDVKLEELRDLKDCDGRMTAFHLSKDHDKLIEGDQQVHRVIILDKKSKPAEIIIDESKKNSNNKDESSSERPVKSSVRVEGYKMNPDDFIVYPNPNKGSFELKFHLDTPGKTDIEVVDASGRLVYSETLENFSGYYSKQIDLPVKGKGVYLLRVKQGENWMHKKLAVK